MPLCRNAYESVQQYSEHWEDTYNNKNMSDQKGGVIVSRSQTHPTASEGKGSGQLTIELRVVPKATG